MIIYTTNDGRVIRSANPIPNAWVNNRNIADMRKLPKGPHDFDVISPRTNDLLNEAIEGFWLTADTAIAQPFQRSCHNYCVCANETIYICNGQYIPLHDFLKTASFLEKKVVITRLALQLYYCSRVLTLDSFALANDILTAQSEQILRDYHDTYCVNAQKNLESANTAYPTDLCVFLNDSLYIRNENGQYQKLTAVLKSMRKTEADKFLRRLASNAAALHCFITKQKSAV